MSAELFFRGALLPATSLAVSSAVFALLHVGPRLRHLPWTLSSLVAGLLLFRLLYYIVPFIFALVILGSRELWLNLKARAPPDLRGPAQ